MTTTTRRAVLAGAAALPVAGLVVPAAAADDPAVLAYRAWIDARRAHWHYIEVVCDGDWSDDDEEEERLHELEWQARKALAETVATTPAGVACQLRLAFDLFHGQSGPNDGPEHPETYIFENWAEDIDGSVMRNMLAALERMAGKRMDGAV